MTRWVAHSAGSALTSRASSTPVRPGMFMSATTLWMGFPLCAASRITAKASSPSSASVTFMPQLRV
jgi:hypothetical protein